MKKFLSICLSIILLTMSLASCQNAGSVKVNGTPVDSEVYKYFEDVAKSGEKTVDELLVHYVTVNSESNSKNIVIPKAQREKLSKKVNTIWSFYNKYYEDLGISKETIYKIETSKMLYDRLLVEYYSENGTSPVSEDVIKAYFDENYISVRYVTDYYFNINEEGKSVPLNDVERTALLEKFNSVSATINEGTSIEEAVSALNTSGEIQNALVNSFSDDTLPEGFFKSAQSIEKGKVGVISLGDYIFLCKRENPFDGEFGHYLEYRDDCLIKMKNDEFSKIFAEWEKSYSVD